jgi:hypothetical protein
MPLKSKKRGNESSVSKRFSLSQKTFSCTRWTYYAALAVLVVTLLGVAITPLHR